jgi:DNA polymerase I-like protein with 3'-5' exonuclease and polymerase domains
MIKFVSPLKFKDASNKIENINIVEAIDLLKNEPIIGLDTENSSLDCYRALPILLSAGTKTKKIVLDTLNLPKEDVLKFLQSLDDKLLLLANAKYDYKVIKAQFGYELGEIYDVMLAEQTIRMGLSVQIRLKIVEGNGLDKIIWRYLKIRTEFDKSTRDDFINASTNFKIEARHVIYAADDISYLEDIKDKQKVILDKYNMTDWVYNIECSLTKIIGDAEVEGIPFNSKKWLENVKESKKRADILEKEMDIVVSTKLEGDPSLVGSKYFRERKKEELLQTSMFDIPATKISNKNKGNVNYSSNAQIKKLFKDLGHPVPMIKDPTTKEYKESTGIPALENFMLEYPEIDEIKDFLSLFIEYQKLSKELSSFGENYIEAVSPFTNNIHTIYRQCSADTGRFQSGGGKSDPDKINSQQIPRGEKFRTCFGGENDKYKYMTLDLSGAELVILASLSKDDYLSSILDDPHSPLATAAYNNIIKYILNNMCNKNFPWGRRAILGEIPKDEAKANKRVLQELEDLLGNRERALYAYKAGEFTITKKDAKDLRNGFKAVIYGLAYGATAKKLAETLRISEVYANLIIEALSKTIPKTFRYLEQVSSQGLKQGYIILSERSGNRRWFYEVATNLGGRIDKRVISSVERACKNSPIQGSQAAMVKEASVEIANYFKRENIDAKILMWIHDEWFIRIPKNDTYHINTEGKTVSSLTEKISEIISETCNRYLDGLEMENEYEISDTWVK